MPATLRPGLMEDTVTLRFRVGKNLRNATVRVTADGRELLTRKRPVMAPGEMEQIVLKKEWFKGGEENIAVWAGEKEAR